MFHEKCSPRAELKSRPFTATPSHLPETQNERYDFSERGENVADHINNLSPRKGGRYYLRPIFLQSTGAENISDMITVSGLACVPNYEDFHKLGFLKVVSEFKIILCYSFTSSFQPLTERFALIILYWQLGDLKAPFFDRKDIFIADLREGLQGHPEPRDEALSQKFIYAEIH